MSKKVSLPCGCSREIISGKMYGRMWILTEDNTSHTIEERTIYSYCNRHGTHIDILEQRIEELQQSLNGLKNSIHKKFEKKDGI